MAQFATLDPWSSYAEYCMRRLPVCSCAPAPARRAAPADRRDANASADAPAGNASAAGGGNVSVAAVRAAGPSESTACCDGVRRQVRRGHGGRLRGRSSSDLQR